MNCSPGAEAGSGQTGRLLFTRPLGASFGDLLSQPTQYSGMGLGTVITSALFLGAIIMIVVYMSVSRDLRA